MAHRNAAVDLRPCRFQLVSIAPSRAGDVPEREREALAPKSRTPEALFQQGFCRPWRAKHLLENSRLEIDIRDPEVVRKGCPGLGGVHYGDHYICDGAILNREYDHSLRGLSAYASPEEQARAFPKPQNCHERESA